MTQMFAAVHFASGTIDPIREEVPYAIAVSDDKQKLIDWVVNHMTNEVDPATQEPLWSDVEVQVEDAYGETAITARFNWEEEPDEGAETDTYYVIRAVEVI